MTQKLPYNMMGDVITCRLCRTTCNCSVDIFNPKGTRGLIVWRVIKDLLQLDVCKEDGLPSTICESCMEKVVGFRSFKTMCINSRIEFLKESVNVGLVAIPTGACSSEVFAFSPSLHVPAAVVDSSQRAETDPFECISKEQIPCRVIAVSPSNVGVSAVSTTTWEDGLPPEKGSRRLDEFIGSLKTCDIPNCQKVFSSYKALVIHKRSKHPKHQPITRPFPTEMGGGTYPSEQRSAASGDAEVLLCDFPGCKERFSTPGALLSHKMVLHEVSSDAAERERSPSSGGEECTNVYGDCEVVELEEGMSAGVVMTLDEGNPRRQESNLSLPFPSSSSHSLASLPGDLGDSSSSAKQSQTERRMDKASSSSSHKGVEERKKDCAGEKSPRRRSSKRLKESSCKPSSSKTECLKALTMDEIHILDLVRRRRQRARERLQFLRYNRNRLRDIRDTSDPFAVSNDVFKGLYRLKKEMTRDLIEELRPHMVHARRSTAIPIELKVLCALHFYGQGSYQKSAGSDSNLGLSQSSVSNVLEEVTAALNSPAILAKWIQFPLTMEARKRLINKNYLAHHIPGVIGFVNGTHVAIKAPQEEENLYLNRKYFHSINVMIVCDSELNIINCLGRFGGSNHDSYVWNESTVKAVMTRVWECGEQCWLLGKPSAVPREVTAVVKNESEENFRSSRMGRMGLQCPDLKGDVGGSSSSFEECGHRAPKYGWPTGSREDNCHGEEDDRQRQTSSRRGDDVEKKKKKERGSVGFLNSDVYNEEEEGFECEHPSCPRRFQNFRGLLVHYAKVHGWSYGDSSRRKRRH